MLEALLKQGFTLVFLFSIVPLMISSIVGLLVAVIQAATQVQEQSINFLIRFLTISGLIFFFGSFFINEQTNFMREVLRAIITLEV